jgi:3-isopropylmalate dehydrogenase
LTEPAGPGYRVVAIPGDGVGPDVVRAGRAVLDTAGERFGFRIDWQEILMGGAAIDAYGVAIRPEDIERCAAADAVYLGAVGGPKWDNPNASVRPEQGLLALRRELVLFGNLRPVAVHPALVASAPLRPELLAGVDLLIVRELTGGLYFGRPSEERATSAGRIAVDTLTYSESEIARVVRLAFGLARGRRKKLTSVDKANVLSSSRLWRKVVEEIRPEYPDVEVEHRLVDACAMVLVTRPAQFDVLVMENLFGDILSDEASVLAGSLGMLPSASIGERRTAHGLHGLYEPIHGSAPDIAGRDLANPIGTILSGAMLLRWSLGQTAAAEAIESAVAQTLDDGFRTRDLLGPGGSSAAGIREVGTLAMTQAVLDRTSGAASPKPSRQTSGAASPKPSGAASPTSALDRAASGERRDPTSALDRAASGERTNPSAPGNPA